MLTIATVALERHDGFSRAFVANRAANAAASKWDFHKTICFIVNCVQVVPFVSTMCNAAGLVTCSAHLYPNFNRSIPPKNLSPLPRMIGDTAKIGRDTSELQSRSDLVCRLLLEK